MARPLRNQWRIRTVVRRRHRTWVASMTLATLGWGVWWGALFVAELVPGWTPSLLIVEVVASALAAVGLFLAIFTVRAKLIWVLLAGVPVFANASLLCMPVVADRILLAERL